MPSEIPPGTWTSAGRQEGVGACESPLLQVADSIRLWVIPGRDPNFRVSRNCTQEVHLASSVENRRRLEHDAQHFDLDDIRCAIVCGAGAGTTLIPVTLPGITRPVPKFSQLERGSHPNCVSHNALGSGLLRSLRRPSRKVPTD